MLEEGQREAVQKSGGAEGTAATFDAPITAGVSPGFDAHANPQSDALEVSNVTSGVVMMETQGEGEGMDAKDETMDSDTDSDPARSNPQSGISSKVKQRRKATQRPVGSDQKRQAFSKRKRGLVMKSYQLYKLTDAKVFLFVTNDKGGSWAYATPGFGATLHPRHLKHMRDLAALAPTMRNITEVMSHPKVDKHDAQVDDRHVHLSGPDRDTITERMGPQGAQGREGYRERFMPAESANKADPSSGLQAQASHGMVLFGDPTQHSLPRRANDSQQGGQYGVVMQSDDEIRRQQQQQQQQAAAHALVIQQAQQLQSLAYQQAQQQQVGRDNAQLQSPLQQQQPQHQRMLQLHQQQHQVQQQHQHPSEVQQHQQGMMPHQLLLHNQQHHVMPDRTRQQQLQQQQGGPDVQMHQQGMQQQPHTVLPDLQHKQGLPLLQQQRYQLQLPQQQQQQQRVLQLDLSGSTGQIGVSQPGSMTSAHSGDAIRHPLHRPPSKVGRIDRTLHLGHQEEETSEVVPTMSGWQGQSFMGHSYSKAMSGPQPQQEEAAEGGSAGAGPHTGEQLPPLSHLEQLEESSRRARVLQLSSLADVASRPAASRSSTGTSDTMSLSQATTMQLSLVTQASGLENIVTDGDGNIYRIIQEPMVISQFDAMGIVSEAAGPSSHATSGPPGPEPARAPAACFGQSYSPAPGGTEEMDIMPGEET